jgi:hypothetical protein
MGRSSLIKEQVAVNFVFRSIPIPLSIYPQQPPSMLEPSSLNVGGDDVYWGL